MHLKIKFHNTEESFRTYHCNFILDPNVEFDCQMGNCSVFINCSLRHIAVSVSG